MRLAAELAEACGVAPEGEAGGAPPRPWTSGAALETAERWVEAQDGDPAVWTDEGGAAHGAGAGRRAGRGRRVRSGDRRPRGVGEVVR